MECAGGSGEKRRAVPMKPGMEVAAEAAVDVAAEPAPKRARIATNTEGNVAPLAATDAMDVGGAVVTTGDAPSGAVALTAEFVAMLRAQVMEAERKAEAATEARAAAERNELAEREALVAAKREAAAAMEARVAEEMRQLLGTLVVLSRAGPEVGAVMPSLYGRSALRTSSASDEWPEQYKIDHGWDPTTDSQLAAVLRRLSPEVVAKVSACVPGLAELTAGSSRKGLKRGGKRRSVPGSMGTALRTLEAAVGGVPVCGAWADEATLAVLVRTLGGVDERVAHADHAWKAQAHGRANAATTTFTLADGGTLLEASAQAWKQGAIHLLYMLRARYFDATPAARAALKPWVYALGTDGSNLAVVRLSVEARYGGCGYYVHVQQSAALPLWTTDGEAGVSGLPPGLAVLAAMMLAQGDDLGSRPAVPPTDLRYRRVPETAAAAAAITDVAAWVAPLDLERTDDDWLLLGCGGYAVVHACVADGGDVAVKAVRFPSLDKNCFVEATALARMGNAGAVSAAGCAFIPRLVGGAWQAMPTAAGGTQPVLAALVLSHVGVTLHDAAARVNGTHRWALVLHAIDAVLHALHHAHTVGGVAHGDVRAPNVIYARAPCEPAATAAAAGGGGGAGSGGRVVGGGVGVDGAAPASAAHARHSVCLNDWGLARLDVTPDDVGHDLHGAKLLLLQLGHVSGASAGTRVYTDLPALPAGAAALIACCPGFPAGAAHRTSLGAFLAATSVQSALDALAPLHAVLAPQLDALEWLPWRQAGHVPVAREVVSDNSDAESEW